MKPSLKEQEYLIKKFAEKVGKSDLISNKTTKQIGYGYEESFRKRLKNNEWDINKAYQAWEYEHRNS